MQPIEDPVTNALHWSDSRCHGDNRSWIITFSTGAEPSGESASNLDRQAVDDYAQKRRNPAGSDGLCGLR